MPIIKPTSDLRNKFNEISRICHESGEPVFITKNGRGDMVVMSIARFQQKEAQLELYQKLAEAEAQDASGAPTISHDEMMQKLKDLINE